MRILIVEDHENLRDNLTKTFQVEGYLVDASPTGERGLSLLHEHQYDLIILDIILPDIDGFEVLKHIRESLTVPIIVLTARGELKDRLHGLRTGADDYVVKPFDLEELVARAEVAVRRSKSLSSPVLKAGVVELDDTTKEVVVKGRSIEMSPIEFGILKILIFNRGIIISRSYLYDHLLDGSDTNSASNMIEVYISRLRGKIGKDFIKTRRGQGYIVEAEVTL